MKDGSLINPLTFYESTRKFVTNYVTLYSDNYLIGIGYQSLKFNYFKTDSSYISSHTINETISDIVEAKRHDITIYLTNSGKMYWVDDSNFPSVSNKYLLKSGLLGTIKAVLSPSGDYLAVGCSL